MKRFFYDYNGDNRAYDSGYYVYGYDRLGAKTLKDDIERFKDAYVPHDDCRDYIGCGQPWFRPQYRNNA